MSESEKKMLDAVSVTLTNKQIDELAAVAKIRVENEETSNTTVQQLANAAIVIGISYHKRYNERKNKIAAAEAATARKVAELEAILAASKDPAKLKALLAKYEAK